MIKYHCFSTEDKNTIWMIVLFGRMTWLSTIMISPTRWMAWIIMLSMIIPHESKVYAVTFEMVLQLLFWYCYLPKHEMHAFVGMKRAWSASATLTLFRKLLYESQ